MGTLQLSGHTGSPEQVGAARRERTRAEGWGEGGERIAQRQSASECCQTSAVNVCVCVVCACVGRSGARKMQVGRGSNEMQAPSPRPRRPFPRKAGIIILTAVEGGKSGNQTASRSAVFLAAMRARERERARERDKKHKKEKKRRIFNEKQRPRRAARASEAASKSDGSERHSDERDGFPWAKRKLQATPTELQRCWGLLWCVWSGLSPGT